MAVGVVVVTSPRNERPDRGPARERSSRIGSGVGAGDGSRRLHVRTQPPSMALPTSNPFSHHHPEKMPVVVSVVVVTAVVVAAVSVVVVAVVSEGAVSVMVVPAVSVVAVSGLVVRVGSSQMW